MKLKALFTIFKGLSTTKKQKKVLEGESPTLNVALFSIFYLVCQCLSSMMGYKSFKVGWNCIQYVFVYKQFLNHRSCHRESCVKKDVLKNFANVRGKRLCWNLFLIKWQDLKLYPTEVFSCEICKIFENTYFEKHLRTTASKIIQTLAIFILSTLTHFMQYSSFYTL